MTRVFSAVEIENSEVLDELARVRDLLDHDFRPIPAEKMHVTLQFFPDLNNEEIETVAETLEEASMDEFQMKIRGVGAFPSRDYIRVVWAGIQSSELEKLRRQVTDHRVEDENREFHPHVSLFRVENIGKNQKRKLQRSLRDFDDHEFGVSKVSRVNLYRSDIDENGSSYHVIRKKELG